MRARIGDPPRRQAPRRDRYTTDLLDKAAAKARDLTPDRQDEIARLMLAVLDDEAPIYQFTPEEEAELDESEAAAARGDFATDEAVRAIWAKHGL